MAIFDGNKMSKEELEAVNGGYRHWVRYEGWEMIDDKTGEKIGDCYYDSWNAEDVARDLGISVYAITDAELADLRKKGKQPDRYKGITW